MDNDFLPRKGSAHSTTSHASPGNNAASFRPPDSVAADDDMHMQLDTPGHDSSSHESYGSPKKRRSFKEWLKSITKKQWIIIVIVALLVLGAGGFALYHFVLKKPKVVSAPIVHKQAQPAATPIAPPISKLTGLPMAEASINQRPVTAVMIENSSDARPQSGLLQAGVVFEAIAEGGITRFLTLFQDTEPDYIGPVRSVRPYYIQWLMGFDAGVAHVGGSGDALAMLKTLGVKDLDQFYNPGPYHRITSRIAPHNMYSSVAALRLLQESKGYTSNYTGFVRKPEAKVATPNATGIDFNISGSFYNPHYDYDAATNSYKRSEGGAPHVDAATGQQLSPKVVVALVMDQGSNGEYTTYNTIGSGEADVFQDGTVQKGAWHKASNTDQMTFTDVNGAPLKLDPGQTWLSVVGAPSRISFK